MQGHGNQSSLQLCILAGNTGVTASPTKTAFALQRCSENSRKGDPTARALTVECNVILTLGWTSADKVEKQNAAITSVYREEADKF